MKSQATTQKAAIRWSLGLAILVAAVLIVPASAWAQSNPGASSAQKPYIMILMDTSASMEWTDEGDEEYPSSDPDGPETEYSEWKAGKERLPTGAEAYGPCYIWEATCNDYERPSWVPDDEWTEAYDGSMSSRLDEMRTAGGMRLEDRSQPRHVTLKEILTGDMVMYREGDEDKAIENISPIDNGPGCWIVPRQRNASAQQDEVCEGSDKFEEFPDYDEPRPHFQEVFDGQRANGLMDTVAGNAIFAIAMFDGYKDSLKDPVKGWDGKHAQNLDDEMDEAFAGIQEGEGDGTDDSDDDKYNYDMGIFQMISPQDLDMSNSLAGQLSNFVQYAFIDAGYLSKDEKKLKPKEDDNDDLLGGLTGLDASFSKELDKYLDEYHMGRQPLARATPLAAAMYDIHQFFAHGSKGKDEESPLLEDPYQQCRPKHVIMMTDGYPEPEAGGLPVGGNTLNAAFGYDPDQYPYTSTEEAIRLFVNDLDYSTGSSRSDGESFVTDDWSSSEGLRYNPRVHIAALQVGAHDDGVDDDLEREAIAKLAEMAIEGKTCAGSYLDDLKVEEGCDPDKEVCLDPRQGEHMRTEYPNHVYSAPDGDEPDCEYPALILTQNDRETMAEVFQRLFNSILSDGVTSRTRPTFVNRLDDPTITNPDDPSDAQGGQFRIYSGVEIDASTPFWRGLLFRESLLCSDDNQDITEDNYLALHKQIEKLAGTVDEDSGDVSQDRRRIFTALPTDAAYDYTENKGLISDTLQADGSRFVFGMQLEAGNSGTDEFGSSYLSAEPLELLDRRVPFEASRLTEVLDTLNVDPDDYFQVPNLDSLEELINEVRGRSELKEDRALGAILNSSPVAVGPPDMDLPIDSYRAYKTLYEDRPSMLYFATTDGLLHAVYSGELHQVDGSEYSTNHQQVKTRAATSPESAGGASETDGSMHEQREAWAYIPQMLHNDLSLYTGQQPYLIDGTPSVKDVRLCHKSQEFNQNAQACRYECNTDECFNRAADNQWRSVLVAGLGEAGSGYFALDVTRPGGAHESAAHSGLQAPDPIPLWEFDPNWERGQVERIGEHAPELVYPQGELDDDDDFIDECDDDRGDDKYFWDQPFMGRSVSEAAIGTVAINPRFDAQASQPLRRPVAIFSAGEAGPFGTSCDREERSGRAIYVVDLQTGTLLRRFVSYNDPDDGDGDERRFEFPVVGSPALYDSSPGSLVTRGFVGDQRGRMFRLDLSSTDPSKWSADLFFDPMDDIDFDDDPDLLGPASFKPAIALGTQATDGDLLVYYGLGERGELTTADQTQLMIAVREDIEVNVSNDDPATATVDGELLWHAEFEGKNDDDDYVEKLTGAPVVFNRGVYFTTFLEPAEDRCEPGWSRIYGMKFEGAYDADDPSSLTDPPRPKGAISNPPSDGVNSTEGGYGSPSNQGDESEDTYWYYQPTGAEDGLNEEIIVRGLTVTLGPSCSTDPAQTGGGMHGSNTQKPTLVAQTSSGAMPGDRMSDDQTGASLTSIEHDLPDPQSQNIPLSWSVIDN